MGLTTEQSRRASSWLKRLWYSAKSPWWDIAARRLWSVALGNESSAGQLVVASRFRGLYDSGASADHHALKASLGCCLANRRRCASDGIAPGGSGSKDPALARPSASSLPGMSVCPCIQRISTSPWDLAKSWNLVNSSCDESAGFPRKQVATARLSMQTTMLLVVGAGQAYGGSQTLEGSKCL